MLRRNFLKTLGVLAAVPAAITKIVKGEPPKEVYRFGRSWRVKKTFTTDAGIVTLRTITWDRWRDGDPRKFPMVGMVSGDGRWVVWRVNHLHQTVDLQLVKSSRPAIQQVDEIISNTMRGAGKETAKIEADAFYGKV